MQKEMLKLMSGVAMASLVYFAAGGVQAQNQTASELPKYGLYLHIGLATFHGYNPHGKEIGTMSPVKFAPTGIDTRGWARAAKMAGMDFAILVVKHEDGFCLWPAKGYDYHVGRSLVKIDILAEYIAACNAEGIKPGIHYSIPDAHNEGQVKFGGPLIPAYYETVKKHITDLHTQYPGIQIQIFDGANRLAPRQFAELCQIIKRLNPACLIIGDTDCKPPDPNHEWIAAFYGIASVNQNWFWSRGSKVTAAQKLYDGYFQCTSKGQAFILNAGVDTTGHIPAAYVAVLMEVKGLIDAAGTTVQPAAVSQRGISPAHGQPSSTVSPDDRVARLKKVKLLFDQGLITKEQYDQKLKEILESL